MIDNIDKLSKNYMRQGLYLTVALSLLTLLVMRVWFLDLLTAVLVSAAFTLVVCGAIGLIWRYVADRKSCRPDKGTAAGGRPVCLHQTEAF